MAVVIKESPAEMQKRLDASYCLFPDTEVRSEISEIIYGNPHLKYLQRSSQAVYAPLSIPLRPEITRDLDLARIAAMFVQYQRKNDTFSTTTDLLENLPLSLPDQEIFLPLHETELERAFQRLGAWDGPFTSKLGSRNELRFWTNRGSQGIVWLLNRFGSETGNETLNAVSHLLSQLGPVAETSILRFLQTDLRSDQAYCLLDALSRMGPRSGNSVGRIAGTLKRYIENPDIDVRQAAVSATSILPAVNALEILRIATISETDSTIQKAIREEISARIRE
jgi:hypothetical protein